MKEQTKSGHNLIAEYYSEYYREILGYINSKINNRQEAEDITQNTFIRLLDYQDMLKGETIRSFIYTIARNLVFDYLRHFYKRQEVESYIINTYKTSSAETESSIIAGDIASHEMKRLSTFPSQRRIIYAMSRFGNKSISEIAGKMQLSSRTVENHLFLGRKEMREYIRECI